jgi:hypothetical protein
MCAPDGNGLLALARAEARVIVQRCNGVLPFTLMENGGVRVVVD